MLHLRSDGPRGPGFSTEDLKAVAAAFQPLQCLKMKIAESVTPPVMVVRIGGQLDTSFQVPTDDSISVSSASASTESPFSSVSKGNSNSDTSVLVSKELLSRIEYLEAENESLSSKKSPTSC